MAATVLATAAAAPPALAEPATTVRYPLGASSTQFRGYAFDTCTAPSLAAMQAWRESPYRAVGIYMGGVNRSCLQPNLSASWVREVTLMRWRLVPIYKGRQAPCTTLDPTDLLIRPSRAAEQGAAAASDAVAKARALGLRPGSAVYYNVEPYDVTRPRCRDAVLSFLSAWTRQLHRSGYLSGVYVNLHHGAEHLVQTYGSTSYARPDAVWIARWDGDPGLFGWSGVPDSSWARGQRGKQYRGDHDETHGGVTLNIDSNRFNAPVATVSYPYRVTSASPLNGRSGPSASRPVTRTFAPGSTVQVVCQTPGSKVDRTVVWDKLVDGTYVTDHYVSTPSETGYSAPLPRCSYPYQVRAAEGVNRRTGPGTGHPVVGRLPTGALARVYCQTRGSLVGNTRVWDRLLDGSYVTDRHVATPSATSYSRPIPRC
ncbi:hypothetical protein DDE18_02640 [Nocardioides gansuensis]|uniref:Rv2525c-like glycoside hydrolase-like domain-containing protein n=1 Tax=Nocardioides gansuensis TaxID=2138300 RepID=A0A2T8FGN3_9ACTN|nr:hypothetical protein DDE18_02640 [Nocardioides gansuensis]